MYLSKKNSNCFLTSSTDNLIKKILISDNFTSYSILAVLKGHNSSVYKAIELNSYLILSCSDDGYLFIWENMNKNQINEIDNNIINNEDMNEDNNLVNYNNASYSSNSNKLNYVNDFLNIKKDNNIHINNNSTLSSKKNILNKANSELIFEMNKYQITKKLNQVLNRGEVVYDILQINHELFVTSSLYGYLRFWDINSMTNTDIIKEIQCNDSHNCLCMINRTVIGVLLNEKYGIALVDYNKKEVSHKIIVDKDLEIKLSTILLTSNKLVVIGGQNNGSNEESQVIYKFYKIIKVKKANSTNFKYSLKFLNAHVKKSQKLLADDDVWLNAMAEGNNGTIINGLGSTNMNKEFGQIDIFFREIKNKNIKEGAKDSMNNFSDNKNKK
jgi:WD40 repeat protein